MTAYRERTLSLAVVAAALFLAAAPGLAGEACALDEAAGVEEATPSTIRLDEGRLTGTFENRPLAEILEAIGEAGGFAHEGGEDHLSSRVSGRFKEVPWTKALQKILQPFNYIMLLDTEGKIARVRVLGLKPGAETAAAPSTAAAGNHTESDRSEAADEPAQADLGEFEPPAGDVDPNDAEAGRSGGGALEIADKDAGPNALDGSDAESEDRPELEPVVGVAGPNALTAAPETLPEAAPDVGESDPNASEAASQGLLPDTDPNAECQ